MRVDPTCGRGWALAASLLSCARAPAPAAPIAGVEPAPREAAPREPASSEPASSEPAPSEPAAPPAPPHFERPSQWPPEIVFPDGLDPARASLTQGEGGDLRLHHLVEQGTIAALAAAWAQAFESGGYSLREPCTEAPTYACVWIGHGRTVGIEIGPGWDEGSVGASVQWLPSGHVPLARLPGPCVTPPERTREFEVHTGGIDQQGEFRQANSRWSLSTRPSIDLDGDGRADVLVPDAKRGDCPWEVPYDVYVMRGRCGHKLGTIVGGIDPVSFTSRFRNGLREVFTSADWASHGDALIPEHHTRERRYVFTGRTLRQVQDITRSGRCHHCGVSSCSEP